MLQPCDTIQAELHSLQGIGPLEVRGSGTREMRVPNFTYPSALTRAATPHLLQTSCTSPGEAREAKEASGVYRKLGL